MKKHLLVLVLILFPFLLHAQGVAGKNVQLGFSLTPNVGWLRFNDADQGTESSGGRLGFSYGILGDFGIAGNDNYYFSTAFAVTTVNGKASTTAPSQLYPKYDPVPASADYTYKLQYIEVPFTLKLKSNRSQIGRFYGQFGLGTAVKISAKSDLSLIGSKLDDVNVAEDINNFRLSLIAGGGAEWNVDRNLSIQTGITFNNGFTDIFDGDGNARNSYFALNLGIFF